MSFLSTILVVAEITVFFLVMLWIWYHWKNRKLLKVARSLPTVLPTVPLLGHGLYLAISLKDASAAFLKFLSTATAKSEGTFCMWIGPVPFITVMKPEDIKVVLNSTKTLERGHEYDLIKFAGGNGLVTASVSRWKITRRHLNSMFQQRNLEHYMPVYNNTIPQLIQKLSRQVDQGPFDVIDLLYRLSLRNVLSLLFGPEVEVDAESQKFKRLFEAVERAGTILATRILKVWLRWEFLFRILHKEDVRKADDMWKNLPDGICKVLRSRQTWSGVDQGIAEGEEKKNRFLNNKEGHKTPITLPDVYDYLRSAHPDFSEKDMQDETKTWLSVGTDTSALAVATCLVVLGRHQRVQEKLYNEIVEVMGKKPRGVTSEDIKNITYLDQVVKEVLRRFAPLPFILRRATEETKLSNCTIPVGATIVVSIAGLHMNPKLHADPETFDPDRFSPENIVKMDRYAFLPFGGGPRDCIGKQYAMIAVKTTLIHILREFKVTTQMNINKMKFVFRVVMFSKDGYKIELEKRKD